MFHLFIWKWQPMLLDTFSDYATANAAMQLIKNEYPQQKVWVEPVVCRDDVEYTLDKFRSL